MSYWRTFRNTHLKNVTVVLMMTVRILSRRTTYGCPEVSPTSGVELRSLSARLLGDVALGRPWVACRSALHVPRVLCLLLLGLFHCSLRLPCFLSILHYFSPREVPLQDICRVKCPRWKKGGLTGRDVLPMCRGYGPSRGLRMQGSVKVK